MTEKTKIIKILLPLLLAAAVLSSCGEGITDRLTAAEVEGYEDYIMSSYFMLRGDTEIAESRAAWDYTETVAFPTSTTPTSYTSNNYPEKGQSTEVTLSKVTGNIYKVVNVTSYPKNEAITSTTETYYVKDYTSGTDDSPDGTYDATVDPICEIDGTLNPLARDMFKTVYDDGTDRDETILAIGGTAGTVHYAEFDIYDSLEFPDKNYTTTLGGGTFNSEGTEWSPGTVTDTSVWSSMVSYDQTLEYDLGFWTYSVHLIGVRYYTEDGGVNTSVTYERTIAKLTADESVGEYDTWSGKLFKGRNKIKVDSADGTVYTETVIRTRIDGNNKKVKSNSNIYDENGTTVVTFTANYENIENGDVISPGTPVVVSY